MSDITFADSLIKIMEGTTWEFTFLVIGGLVGFCAFLYKMWMDYRKDKLEDRKSYTNNKEADDKLLESLKSEMRQLDAELKSFKDSRKDLDAITQKQIDNLHDRMEHLVDLVLKLFPNHN